MRSAHLSGIVRAVVIVCASSITHVNVYARGALVTRRLSLPDTLPDEDIELAAEGITAIAEGNSVRAALPDDSSRAVLAVRAGLSVPASGQLTGASVERVRDLEQRLHRLRNEQNHIGELRAHLASLTLDPGLRARATAAPRDVTSRTADALATSEMLSSLSADLDARESALVTTMFEVERSLDAARLAHSQASTLERIGSGHPTQRVVVHLTGTGSVAWVDLTYAVPAARWWPVYTLRIRDNGRKATWIAEALVAQRSGEDWTNVRLSLSTADLLFDARLPELASLRLGRTQTPSKRAYRTPPAGLDRMFEGYDRAFAISVTVSTSATTTLIVDPGFQTGDLLESAALEEEEAEDDDTRDAGLMRREEATSFGAADRRVAPEKRARMSRSAPNTAPTALAAQMLLPPQSARPKGGSVLGALADGLASLAPGSAGGGGHAAPASVEELPIEPSDAWLDFDSLALKPLADRTRRGRLVRESDTRTAGARSQARDAVEHVAAPPGARDPLHTRGMFDHRYEAEGLAEIPSDAQTHRVLLATGETAPTMRWRTVPREAAEVYREAELRNPFDAPLLAGPVDVYVDGSLLAVASVERIDRGGTMHVGMGVEQRIRVARNVRAREETAGILGGDTVVQHDVSIEVTSAMAQPALVEVLDRLPVSDDKTVEVALVRASPDHERYTQADRGSAVRGGMLWRTIVPAAGKTTIEYAYRVTLPSKNEVVGGNRRD